MLFWHSCWSRLVKMLFWHSCWSRLIKMLFWHSCWGRLVKCYFDIRVGADLLKCCFDIRAGADLLKCYFDIPAGADLLKCYFDIRAGDDLLKWYFDIRADYQEQIMAGICQILKAESYKNDASIVFLYAFQWNTEILQWNRNRYFHSGGRPLKKIRFVLSLTVYKNGIFKNSWLTCTFSSKRFEM